jgi:light-regulated signal transduction histidine kinase (bacteriophytochrome)
MIRQVWVNLISNALKYSRKADRPRIVIGVEETNNEKVFYIKDNGAGFDMKYADKLFGVFQRLHKQEDFEGTGVGLALVKKIVEKHNGRIWAEAAVGRGASFFFSLPSNNGSTQKAIHFASETKANS